MLIGIPIVLLLAAGGGIYLASVSLRPIAEALRIQTTVHRRRVARAPHAGVGHARRRGRHAQSRRIATKPSTAKRWRSSAVRRRRLSRLVEDMLVLARADAGGYPLRPVDLYLDEVVAECRRAVDVLATERGVTIRSCVIPEVPFRGDEDLLRQLVLNVLQNAVQHTPAGGIGRRIDIEQDAGAVTVARHAMPVPEMPPGDRAADLRSVRAARSGPSRSGHRPRSADRAMDRRGAPRYAGPRAERRRRQHLLRFAASVRCRLPTPP